MVQNRRQPALRLQGASRLSSAISCWRAMDSGGRRVVSLDVLVPVARPFFFSASYVFGCAVGTSPGSESNYSENQLINHQNNARQGVADPSHVPGVRPHACWLLAGG